MIFQHRLSTGAACLPVDGPGYFGVKLYSHAPGLEGEEPLLSEKSNFRIWPAASLSSSRLRIFRTKITSERPSLREIRKFLMLGDRKPPTDLVLHIIPKRKSSSSSTPSAYTLAWIGLISPRDLAPANR